MITEQTVIALINEQQKDRLLKIETALHEKNNRTEDEQQALDMLTWYFKCRKEAFEKVNEIAAQGEGSVNVSFEIDIFKVTAQCEVSHTFVQGDIMNPDSHDVDVNINEFKMMCV